MINRLVRVLGILAVAVLACATTARAEVECATCHDDIVKAFGGSTHGRYFAGGKNHQGATCVSCHLGGKEHAESDGEKKPVSLKKGEPREANAACLSCHGGHKKTALWDGSAHQQANLRCTICHEVHKMRLEGTDARRVLQGPTDTTKKCLECHGNQRQTLQARSSHPLREGQMQCSSCHNPHGTTGEKLIDRGSVNELCYSCHQNVRGPFLWEHSPVREDCLTCHRPHNSNYPQLLQARVAQLCQSCHQQGRHQTIPGVPASVFLDNRGCLNCHMMIHGSNHPSGPLFQR